MGKIQKRQNAPQNLGADQVTPAAGSRCACRQPASVRYRNSWREADACQDPEHRMQAMAWVSNRQYSRRQRVLRPVMRPPQTGEMHPFISRALPPRATPPGPRAPSAPVSRAIAPIVAMAKP